MPNRFFTPTALPTAVGTLLCLTTTAVPAETPATMNAEQGWSAISRCSQEDTERARHTCVDKVLRDAGLLTNEMSSRQQRKAFGLDDKPARAPAPSTNTAAATAPTANSAPTASAATPAPAAKTAAAAATPPAAATAPVESSDRLEVELAKVQKAVNGRLFVTTSDGAVWLQTESVTMPIPPVPGDRMSIRKGSLGGYICSVVSTHLTYRCARNR